MSCLTEQEITAWNAENHPVGSMVWCGLAESRIKELEDEIITRTESSAQWRDDYATAQNEIATLESQLTAAKAEIDKVAVRAFHQGCYFACRVNVRGISTEEEASRLLAAGLLGKEES